MDNLDSITLDSSSSWCVCSIPNRKVFIKYTIGSHQSRWLKEVSKGRHFIKLDHLSCHWEIAVKSHNTMLFNHLKGWLETVQQSTLAEMKNNSVLIKSLPVKDKGIWRTRLDAMAQVYKWNSTWENSCLCICSGGKSQELDSDYVCICVSVNNFIHLYLYSLSKGAQRYYLWLCLKTRKQTFVFPYLCFKKNQQLLREEFNSRIYERKITN